MTTCAEYATLLADAQAALHKVILGGKVEMIRDGVNQLTYTKASLPDLRAYIAELQRRVDCCNGVRRRGRAILTMPVDY